MQCVTSIAMFSVLIFVCHAEVTLVRGVNQIVAFDGDALLIKLSNPRNSKEDIGLCFGSLSAKNKNCPQGYAGIAYPTNGQHETYKLGRNGILTYSGGTILMRGEVHFENDGTLNVLITELPDGASVTLPNARIPVTTSTSLATTEKTSNKAVTGVVIGLVVFVVIAIVITIGVLLYCCWWKKRAQQPIPAATPNAELNRTRDDPDAVEPLLPKVVVKSPAAPPPKRTSATTTTTKRTSTSTTKPSDEPIVPSAPPKPKPMLKTPITVLVKEPESVLSLTSDATQQSTPVTPKKGKSKASVRKAKSRKSHKHIATPKAQAPPAEKPGSPSLPVDRTQSPTVPSTLPTPSYTNDTVTNARAEESDYKKREYLRRSEAQVPGSVRSRPRSRPIVDEKQEMRLQTETYPCFAERMGTLDNHNHWMLVSRVKGKETHVVSDAERALLKAAPEDAPALADKVLEEAVQRMAPFLFGHSLGWTEETGLWAMINKAKTPTSDGYIAMYRLMPSLFKLERPSISDPLVRKMPICGIYILLLDRTLPNAFRVKLAEELRTRASRILPFVQKYQMKNVCFPTNYLMLIYNKNQKSFIEKKEIHSQILMKN